MEMETEAKEDRTHTIRERYREKVGPTGKYLRMLNGDIQERCVTRGKEGFLNQEKIDKFMWLIFLSVFAFVSLWQTSLQSEHTWKETCG